MKKQKMIDWKKHIASWNKWKPETKYVKKIIASWKKFDEDKYDNLIFIEKVATVGAYGMGASMKWSSMKDNEECKKHYHAILQETNPERLRTKIKEEKRDEEKERLEEKRAEQWLNNETRKKKEEWKKISKKSKEPNKFKHLTL